MVWSDESDREWLTEEECARRLGCSLTRVRELVERNVLRAHYNCYGGIEVECAYLGAVSAGRRLLRPDDLRTPGGAIVFSRFGPPHRTHAIGARSTIDEVRDRLRRTGGLPKIRTPGAQTGRCARRRATITACPVGWG